MGKVLLFYKYVFLQYPKQILKWQTKICKELGLTGRILLAHEGINGTLGGDTESIERYKEIVHQHPLFSDIVFKESPGNAACFNRLQVVVKNEIVNLGIDATITPEHGGKHLTPQETHELIKHNPADLVIFDTRNKTETRIGRFEQALLPDITNFRELPEYIDNNPQLFKDKTVLMYCTGGVRCERATAYLKSKNIAKEVLQIEGGIHCYAEQYPDGFFKGKNYVFDNRLALKVTDDILGTCDLCTIPCDAYNNCMNARCNKHFIGCDTCIEKFSGACSQHCYELIKTHQVPLRPVFNKISIDEQQTI